MAPPQPAQSIVQHCRGITTTLWLVCRAGKAQRPAYVDKRQARGHGSARRHRDVEGCWIQQGIRSEGQVDAVKTEPNRVGKRRAKEMVLTEGRQVPEAVAGVSESRKVRTDRASCRRFLSEILLHHVIGVDTILAG